MDLRLNPHLPIITPRIEFSSLSQPRPPTSITPRIDFADLWIRGNDSPTHAVSDIIAPSDDDSTTMDFDSPESESSDDEMLPNNNGKIPKPSGAPGRPNSGGYNIENELRPWGADKISRVIKFVKSNADEFLDTTQSYSKQSSSEITRICEMSAIQFPIVNKYENHWPVRDILKLHLKYTSEIHRKQGGASKAKATSKRKEPRK